MALGLRASAADHIRAAPHTRSQVIQADADHPNDQALSPPVRTRLLSGNGTTSITGHIDFLQVRNGAVHILDYKPDARTNRPIAQLTIYALALAHLTGIKLFDIKCAWFNENEYCEFFLANCSCQRRDRPNAIMRGERDYDETPQEVRNPS